MDRDHDLELLKFIKEHPTSFHVTAGQCAVLEKAGYERLFENESFSLKPGGKYFVTRNDSALVAFRIPERDFDGFRICASHGDSPAFRIKEGPEIESEGKYVRLNTELYGGALIAQWFDRPLSAAGRLCLEAGDGSLQTVLFDLKKPVALIPSLAIHMDREANNGKKYDLQRDMLPLYGTTPDKPLAALAAESAGLDPDEIQGYDIILYNAQEPVIFGDRDQFLASPRLDDVQCAYSSFTGFLDAGEISKIPVHAVFDNEEIGSSTKQGANSDLLRNTLMRILSAFHKNEEQAAICFANSFLISADNAHGLHPNHPEACDPVNRPVLGGGPVLKFSGSQKYTTDAYSAAKVRQLANRAGIKLQVFTNRSNIPGGSTLGNISVRQISFPAADVGIAQLAMHSPYETCGRGIRKSW